MKILVIGAGAVGRTFAYHLQRGGAEIAFLVKPKYAGEARAGYTLYDLSRGRDAPIRFEDFDVLTSTDEVRERQFDVVLITVSSAALNAGDWVQELIAASGDATICGMQPGPGDQEKVQAMAGADRVVWGLIELIAYQAPLRGEQVPEPGVAYWIPWPLFFPFSGPADRTSAVVAAFRTGGLRARHVADAAATTALGAPWLNLHIAALESVGWKLDALKRDKELLALTSRAIREAITGAAHGLGVRVPLWVRFLAPWQVRLVLTLAPRVMPLDLETYLAFHFTKVGEQTRMILDRWIAANEAAGLAAGALREIRDRRGGLDSAA